MKSYHQNYWAYEYTVCQDFHQPGYTLCRHYHPLVLIQDLIQSVRKYIAYSISHCNKVTHCLSHLRCKPPTLFHGISYSISYCNKVSHCLCYLSCKLYQHCLMGTVTIYISLEARVLQHLKLPTCYKQIRYECCTQVQFFSD